METVLMFVILMWVPSIVIFIMGVTETIRDSRWHSKFKKIAEGQDAD